jgi:hypothetical protein
MKGASQIEDFYTAKRFNDARLHAAIVKRIVMGNVVIDQEKVAITFPEGPGQFEAIAIYEAQGGKIAKVSLIRGKKSLDPPR